MSFVYHSSVLVCHSYVIRIISCIIHISLGCHSYVLVCHLYVARIYSYVIRMSLVYTCMLSVCHSYVTVSHPYVTHMYSYVTGMSLVCTRMSSVCHPYVTCMWLYHEPFSSVNIIDPTCFDECFLLQVITGRYYFYTNLSLRRDLVQSPCCCALWHKCFERSPHFISVISTITLQCR